MKTNKTASRLARRKFLSAVAAGAAGVAALSTPLQLMAKTFTPEEQMMDDADLWFNGIKGKHRMVFDASRPHEVFPFAWPRIFLFSNEKTGSPAKDCGVVVVLRHNAIPYAFENHLWEKYKFGELFSAMDPLTKTPAVRNPFWQPTQGDFQIPGIGSVAIGINDLQADGVMFCVCDSAITVNSAVTAGKMNKEAADVKKDWMSGLLPGIQVVPSGVWAIGRAQEKGCGYCFAG